MASIPGARGVAKETLTMARKPAAKTATRTGAKAPVRPARQRAPRATATTAASDKATEASVSRTAERAQAGAAAGAHPHGPEAFGAAISGFMKSLSGLQLPQDRLAELQEQYVNQATALWNGAVEQIPVGGDGP